MIVPRLGISRRRHLPVLKILDHSVSLFSGPAIVRRFRRWSLDGVAGSDLVQVATPLDKLVMSRDRAGMMLYEWGSWTRFYVPAEFDFHGKTVLDVGAGEGETVELYRFHGARRFVCVEPDAQRAARLRENAGRNGWDADIHEEPFSLKFLQSGFDFMKMDCEGCERTLIGTRLDFPCVLETHGTSTEEFLKMDGFSAVMMGTKTALVSNAGAFRRAG